MGVDAFGTPRYRCTDKSGCLCADFISTLDGMSSDDKTQMEANSRVLTCQRKSELVLNCTCGHPAWVHASQPDDQLCSPVATDDSADQQEESDSDWRALLKGNGGDQALLPLAGMLSASHLTVEAAYDLLDASRVKLLESLKRIGVEKLKHRQELCNVLGRARRLEALEDARRANEDAGCAPARWQVKIEEGKVSYAPEE